MPGFFTHSLDAKDEKTVASFLAKPPLRFAFCDFQAAFVLVWQLLDVHFWNSWLLDVYATCSTCCHACWCSWSLVSVARFDIQVQKTACPPPLRPFALSKAYGSSLCLLTLFKKHSAGWKNGILKACVNGLVQGKIYRKPKIFRLNMGLSCKFSLKPIHWMWLSLKSKELQ